MAPLNQKIENILGKKISAVSYVGGGSISTAIKVTLTDARNLFVKTSPQHKDMFIKEANGLRELAKCRAIKIPTVLFADEEILILEYLSPTSPPDKKIFFEKFGRQYAQLHRCTSPSFGFTEDNYIGSTLQKNTPRSASWKEFYHTRRLLFQFHLAEKNGYADAELRKFFLSLEQIIDRLIPDDGEPPALLHGDLWGGNYLCTGVDIPAIIDPAVYYGHREADVAMTMLFGGFGDQFYSAYNESYPFGSGWQKRMDLYKLYHLLNHLNLFGEGYFGQVIETMKGLTR